MQLFRLLCLPIPIAVNSSRHKLNNKWRKGSLFTSIFHQTVAYTRVHIYEQSVSTNLFSSHGYNQILLHSMDHNFNQVLKQHDKWRKLNCSSTADSNKSGWITNQCSSWPCNHCKCDLVEPDQDWNPEKSLPWVARMWSRRFLYIFLTFFSVSLPINYIFVSFKSLAPAGMVIPMKVSI